MSFFKKAGAAAGIAFFAVMVSGCGQSSMSFVQNVQFKAFQRYSESYGEVKASLNVGTLQFPAVSLPIADPRNPAVSYGTFAIQPGLSGVVAFTIDLNLTEAARVPGSPALLPNGAALPVGGIDGVDVIQLPVAQTGSQIYFALSNHVALIGAAVPIRELNSMDGYLGGGSLFAPFNLANKAHGMAGVFTGLKPGQNGFALFVDATPLIEKLLEPKSVPATAPAGQAVVSSGLLASPAWPEVESAMKIAVGPSRLRFNPVSSSKASEKRIKNLIYKMQAERARCSLD